MTIRKLAGESQHLRRHRVDPDFTLDDLQKDGAGPGAHELLESLKIVARDMTNIGYEWRKRGLLVRLTGQGQRPVGPSVEAVLKRDNLGTPGSTVLAGELERRLVRFRTGANKEHPAA